MIPLFVAAVLAAGDLPPSAPPLDPRRLHTFECAHPDCVMVGGTALDNLMRRAEQLQRELEKLRESCRAKLDVTEPPRKLPPLKPERTS